MENNLSNEYTVAFYSNEEIFDKLEVWGENAKNELNLKNYRECPQCGNLTIKGMRGSMSAICQECGYKDPCCFD